jgi:protocatechuate 3,4-dioxygenase beta subunit
VGHRSDRTLAVVIALELAAGAQSPRVVSGRVVSATTGDALPNARVALRVAAVGNPVVLTDADGRFTLAAQADRVVLSVSKSGYGPREVAATSGAPLDIPLARGAAVSGRVIDQYGDPVPGARVTAETRSDGPSGSTVVASRDTDDRGEYRLSSLPAGRFTIAVTAVGGSIIDFVGPTTIAVRPTIRKIFYPRASAIGDAELFELQPGGEQTDIDFLVPAREMELPPMALVQQAAQRNAGAAPPPVPRTGVIRGRVVSTDGRAVPYALLRLTAPFDLAQSRVGRAGVDGRFEFSDLGEGKYGLVAAKVGHSPAAPSDPSRAADIAPTLERIVDLAAGATREGIDVTLARWGTIAGRVADENGDPMEGVSVQVMRIGYEAGRRRLVPADDVRLTDDLGRYRLYSLKPGQYVVAARVGYVAGADVPGYARSYFPGTVNASAAQFVSVGLSQEVAGVDFPLARVRTARVSGKILDASGQPTMGGAFALRSSQRAAGVTSESISGRILGDGTFEFPNVPPGQYVMQSYRGRSRQWIEGEFGTMPVAVDGADVTGLVFQTSAGSSIAGRVTFDTLDRSHLPPPGAIEIVPVPSDPDLSPVNSWAVANIHDDWTFEMGGINGPRRLEVMRAPAGWAVREIRVHGVDVTDRPLPFGRSNQSLNDVEIVLTDRVNQLTGTVTDDGARAVTGSLVIVFSTDRDRWYPASRFLRKATTAAEGVYTIAGLPYGSYYAAAIGRLPTEDADSWQDPAFLESLRVSASTLTLGDGAKQTLNLRAAR